MKVSSLKFPGVFIIEPRIFEDKRGHFLETFQAQRYSAVWDSPKICPGQSILFPTGSSARPALSTAAAPRQVSLHRPGGHLRRGLGHPEELSKLWEMDQYGLRFPGIPAVVRS